MKLITQKVPSSFNLFLFGDTHEGSLLFYNHGFDKFIDMVKSEYDGCGSNYCIHHGDGIEAITVDDKRFSLATIGKDIPQPLAQAQKHVESLMPIAKNIITMLNGNHEYGLHRFGDLTGYMCNELNVEPGTYTAKISFVDKKNRPLFKHFCTHGRRSVSSTADDPLRRQTNMELIIKRHLKFKAGDCITMSKGHTHKLIVCQPKSELYLVDDGHEIVQKYTKSDKTGGYIHPDHRWYINTGSFLKLYGDGVSGYGELFEYDPIELGVAVIMVRNQKIDGVRRIVL